MSTVSIIIQNAPYQPDNKAWHALRFAGAALAEDMTVRVHLLDKGVEMSRRSHPVPEGATNLQELLSELMEYGIEVCACGMSLDDFQISPSEMLDGIEKSSMRRLATWVNDCDHVITF